MAQVAMVIIKYHSRTYLKNQQKYLHVYNLQFGQDWVGITHLYMVSPTWAACRLGATNRRLTHVTTDVSYIPRLWAVGWRAYKALY